MTSRTLTPPASDPHRGSSTIDGPPVPQSSTSVERLLRHMVEGIAVALILAEVAILLSGVIARYVFHSPIGWTDELASVLFLWIAMLGSAIAFRRAEHMRLTFVLERMKPGMRAWTEAFGLTVALLFLMAMLTPAVRFTQHEQMITTPALGISNSLRVAAIPAGFALMIAFGLVRMWHTCTWRQLGVALALLACAAATFHLGTPWLKSIGNLNLLIFFGLTVTVALALGVPIGFAFGVATLAYVVFGTRTPTLVIVGRIEEGASHLILLAVPLFILLGALMELAGLARAMVAFLASLLGHVRGGLNLVLLGGMYLVSGISGSKVADMAAVAPVLFPEMRKRGQKPGEMVALLATSGAMAETIPPSLVLITIGSVTSISIAALFIGGLLPALVGLLMMAVVVWLQTRHEDMSGVERAAPRQIARLLLVALPALALPFIIRTAVVEGVATATEVSTIGIFYTVLAGVVIYRRFNWRLLYPMLLDTAALSGAILLIVGCATAMAWALTQSGFSQDLVKVMTAVPGGKWGFLVVSAIAFMVLGSVLEGIPAIVLFGPLLFPIARIVGVHEVHYAMVVIFAMGLGLFAPPFGVGFYAACAIGRVSPDVAIGRVWPHLAALVVALMILVAVPWLSIGFL